MTYGVRWLRLAAAFCLAMAVLMWATLVPAMFDPPPWNRAHRFLAADAWFYVGYIHWRLARYVATAETEAGDAR